MTMSQYQGARRSFLALLIVVALMATMVLQGQAGSAKLHDLVEMVGIALIAVGIVGRLWCTLYIGGRKSAEIVASGPYSVCRNPLYLFSTVAAAGVGAQTGSWAIAIVAMLVCAAAFAIVIRREERYLDSKFGPAFGLYRQRVPRFLPNFRLYEDRAEVTVRPRHIYTTFADGLVFFISIPLLESIEHFQNTGVLPVLIHMP